MRGGKAILMEKHKPILEMWRDQGVTHRAFNPDNPDEMSKSLEHKKGANGRMYMWNCQDG